MQIPPKHKVTSEIQDILNQIESLHLLFATLKIDPQISEKLQRVTLLQSSVFSARIEGNPLTVDQFSNASDGVKKIEIRNLMLAYKYIEKQFTEKKKLALTHILELHKIVLENLSPDAGRLRREMGAIFNQAGVAVYVSPPPDQLNSLLKQLLDYLRSPAEKNPLVRSAIGHLIFEKIHPFIDGNGRVGRLLMHAVLRSDSWQTTITAPWEQYLDENKETYYFFMDKGMSQTTDYLKFMLSGLLEQMHKTRALIETEMENKKNIFLPPRQEEIFAIISEHRLVSFDVIRRRFLKVPERTLRYDLKKLQEQNLIFKIGHTRGSYYSAKS